MTATSYENDHDRIITIHNYVSGTDEQYFTRSRLVRYCGQKVSLSRRKILFVIKFSSHASIVGDRHSRRKIELCLQHCIKNTLNVDEESDVEVYADSISGYDTHTIERIPGEYGCSSGDAAGRVFDTLIITTTILGEPMRAYTIL